MSRDIFHQARLLRAPSNLALNTAREGAATAFLGKLLLSASKRSEGEQTGKNLRREGWIKSSTRTDAQSCYLSQQKGCK